MCAGACNSVSSRLSVNSSKSRLPSVFLFFNLGFLRDPHQSPGASPSLRSWAGLVENKSCNVDVEDEMPPELVDKPGTTRGAKLSVLHTIVFPALVNRGFWPLTHSWEYPWSTKSFPSHRTASASSRNCTVTKKFRSWTKTCASSFVCASPLAVSNTVGFSGSSQSINFIWAQVPFAHHVHWYSWIDYEFSLLWSLRSGCRHYPCFNRSIKRSFVRILELVNIFAKSHASYSAGASFLLQGLLFWPLLKPGRARTTLMRFTLMDNTSRWTLSFPIFF